MLTQAQLIQELRYEPDTGRFVRLVDKRTGKSGKETGWLNKGGYLYVRAVGKPYLAHRLAFLYMTGSFPVHDVDHVNGVRNDNSWCNLRAATTSENAQNLREAHSNSRSGLLGVSWHRNRQKWQARIRGNGVSHHLGYFTCPQEAHAAYLRAKAELHPFSTI